MATIYGVPSRLIGNVGVDTNSPVTALHVSTSSTAFPRGILSAQYNTGTDGALFISRKARGNQDGPSTVAVSDVLGEWSVEGYDSANYLRMGKIRVEATGTIAATRVPTQIVFSTATDATPSVLTDRMWLLAGGNLGVGIVPTGIGHFYASSPTLKVEDSSASHIALVGCYSSAGANWVFGKRTSTTFAIREDATADRLTVVTGGAVGIGTTVPGSFGLAINHATGQSLDLIYNDSDGSPANHATLTVSSGGNLTINATGNVIDLNQTIGFRTTGGTLLGRIAATANGIFRITNDAENDFSRLGLGGTTSSFPAIKRSSTTLAFRLADDSADAPISASNGTFSGYIVGGVQSLSGAGAVNVTQAITEVTTTGAAQALTLADGVAGQEKTIIHGVDGGSFVLTPSTRNGWTSFTSTAAGESIKLVFLTTRGWTVVGSYLGVIV